MPLYEYKCDACGHRFEEIRRFSDPPVEKCPSCGASAVRKLISSPAIQFKGTGWYITDYAKKDQAPADTEKSDTKDPKDSRDSKEPKQPKDATGSKDEKGSKGATESKNATSEKTSTSETTNVSAPTTTPAKT